MKIVNKRIPHDKDHPYSVISNVVLRWEGKSPGPFARCVWLYLRSLPETSYKSNKKLAYHFHCAEQTIFRALNDLEEWSWIEREGEGRNAIYTILDPGG